MILVTTRIFYTRLGRAFPSFDLSRFLCFDNNLNEVECSGVFLARFTVPVKTNMSS